MEFNHLLEVMFEALLNLGGFCSDFVTWGLAICLLVRLGKTGRTVVGRTFDWMDGRPYAVSVLSDSFLVGPPKIVQNQKTIVFVPKIQYSPMKNKFNSFNTEQQSIRKSKNVSFS